MNEFDKYYKQLNKAQKEAVDAVEGPVMVVAGPGTGKTQILTLRIANILKQTQTGPENILALTFTQAGASNMRRRLADMIGSPAYRVAINTFHGFCNDIIKNYPAEFPRIIGSESITEVDQVRIIEEAVDTLSLKELKPFGDPLYYVRAIKASIDQLKREGVAPERFNELLKKEQTDFDSIEDLRHEKGAHKGKIKGDYQKLQKQISKNLELADVYTYYQEALTKQKLYDYSDMIMEVVRELQTNADLLLQLQEQYQYILVDEHQDTNNAQNRVIELLCNFHPDPNLFVVGDEKQAIFRFQGASLENFIYFQRLYPSAKLIVLENNYRSTQHILDAAHQVLAGKKELTAQAGHTEAKIRLGEFQRPDEELFFIADDIQKKIATGIQPGEITVLYRDNRDAFEVARMLEKFGVPFIIESDQDIMSDSEVRKLLLLLRAIVEFGFDERFLETLHIDFLNIDPLDVYKLINLANERRVPAYEVVSEFPAIEEFYKKLATWQTLSHNVGAEEVFERVVRESGLLASILKSSVLIEKLESINCLFDELKSLVTRNKDFRLKDFMAYLDTLRTHNILIKKSVSSQVSAVRLMTAHRSKGQEFAHVYIVFAYDGHWGNKRRPNLLKLPESVFSLTGNKVESDNEDERRLFYVALTRAKHEATITYSKEDRDGQEQLPCQFLTEIKPDLIAEIDAETTRVAFGKRREIIFAEPPQVHNDAPAHEYIVQLFKERGLSVTGLNNYLECPWKYFYTNLLRIPKAKSIHQMYGIAVHGALRDLFAESKLSREFLLERFTHHLNREPIAEKDLSTCLKKGTAALGGYFDEFHATWTNKALTEFSVRGILLTPDIRLTGNIDKIELRADGTVKVTDYKTSKPKTRGEIEGSTKTSNGNIKRQLVFYKLLLDKYEDGRKYKMEAADIDFIEPDDKGRYHRETFHIEDTEVLELEELIKQKAADIMALTFWNTTCDDKECEFCPLRKLMKPL